MSISGRITETIEGWRTLWGEAFKSFMVRIISYGLEIFMDILGKSFAPKLTPLINKLESLGEIPAELKPILDEIRNPTGEVGALLAQSAGGALVGGALGSLIDALFLRFSYEVNEKLHPKLPNESQLIAMWLRKIIGDADLDSYLKKLGADDITITTLKELSQVRLSPDMVMRLWIRDKDLYEPLWKELVDTGLAPARVSFLKELSWAVPSPSDVINFAAKEAFEDKMAEIYGLDAEYDAVDQKWMDKAGIKEEARPLYWIAHWQHPALNRVYDLFHRGIITEEEMSRYYRLVEVPPYWRPKLTELSWDLPNRIELRMMARYGLVDKAFLVEQLKKVGLGPDYREIAADMMLAMGIRTDLATRHSKGWITADEVKSELEASGLGTQVQERMYQWIVKNAGTDRVEKERDLTKTEIYKAIKKGKLAASQGVELIQDMGYSREEAILLVEINVGVLAGSPDTYMELKKITQLYRQSQGLKAKIPSEELIQAEKDAIEFDTDEAKIRYHHLLEAWNKE